MIHYINILAIDSGDNTLTTLRSNALPHETIMDIQ